MELRSGFYGHPSGIDHLLFEECTGNVHSAPSPRCKIAATTWYSIHRTAQPCAFMKHGNKTVCRFQHTKVLDRMPRAGKRLFCKQTVVIEPAKPSRKGGCECDNSTSSCRVLPAGFSSLRTISYPYPQSWIRNEPPIEEPISRIVLNTLGMKIKPPGKQVAQAVRIDDPLCR